MCNTDCCTGYGTIFFCRHTTTVFVNPPPNISYTCFEEIPAIQNLSYTDNCDAPGSVAGTQTSSYTNCNGGTLTRTWTKTDLCGNPASYTQTITILPIPPATISGPPNITINCVDIPSAGTLPPAIFYQQQYRKLSYLRKYHTFKS
ncbi:MAG: hypothetical protein IPL08_00030 [Saprospiraceae bacterium]|nr:hypothetical protein [Saprospiraceae bacterium]